jgi:hypothetical protein
MMVTGIIGDMPSGGFAGEYSADVYNGSLRLTVQQHRPINVCLHIITSPLCRHKHDSVFMTILITMMN